MLGMLPPDQFRSRVECSRESLSLLLMSSARSRPRTRCLRPQAATRRISPRRGQMLTGYTLHNVENRLLMQRGLQASLGLTEPLSRGPPQPSAAALRAASPDVQDYVQALEEALSNERAAAEPRTRQGAPNVLMTYLKTVEESQACARCLPPGQI